MSAWLLFPISLIAIWAALRLIGLTIDLIEKARARAEASQANWEKEQFVLHSRASSSPYRLPRQQSQQRRTTPPRHTVNKLENSCPDARAGLRYYRAQAAEWRAKMGAGRTRDRISTRPRESLKCSRIRYLANVWRVRAKVAKREYGEWHHYHYAWADWLPSKWQRIGACETGYGKRPGNWKHSNSSYEGAFGFAKSSWDAFKHYAAPKAGPYPADAWMATPRQQYEVALAIYRRYGFSGWGCRGA